jgi:hypothetical protein
MEEDDKSIMDTQSNYNSVMNYSLWEKNTGTDK